MEELLFAITYSQAGKCLAGGVLGLWFFMILIFLRSMRIAKEQSRIGKRAPKINRPLFYGNVNNYIEPEEHNTMSLSGTGVQGVQNNSYGQDSERFNVHSLNNLYINRKQTPSGRSGEDVSHFGERRYTLKEEEKERGNKILRKFFNMRGSDEL